MPAFAGGKAHRALQSVDEARLAALPVAVRRLRRALPARHGELIETVRGLGYRWRTGPEPMPTPALSSAVSKFVARVHGLSDLPLGAHADVA